MHPNSDLPAQSTEEAALELAAFDEFVQLLELSPDQQALKLESLGHGAPALAARVRALLTADLRYGEGRENGHSEGILERGLARLAPHAVLASGLSCLSCRLFGETFAHPAEHASGEIIGAWRLVEILGRGGMGVVWKAERADDSFAQQAAIKLLKQGMDSSAMINRFERERQILARLEHPGISRLIDGGLTQLAKPYFAMEYVDGLAITTFAQQHALDLRARVALIVQLCLAVDYAHRRLVVHRDIKPSNVLVCANESGPGTVKVLDFGIAKLLDTSDSLIANASGGTRFSPPDRASNNAHETQPQERVMSPAYAAPEQLRGGQITVATDVYGIGLVLYELLTGTLPHERERASALTSPTRHDHTTAPSVLSKRKFSSAPSAGAIALKIDQDLDLITLHALQADPDQRYPSAAALADDLQRWLRSEPICARAPSWRYRSTKMLVRNKLAATAIALAFCTAVTAFAVVISQRHVAVENARLAQAAQHRAELAKNFLIALFERADSFSADSTGERTVVDLLLTGKRLLTESTDDPMVRAELLIEVGTSLGRVGKRQEGIEALSEALGILSRQSNTDRLLQARALGYLGYAQNESGEFFSAEKNLLAAQQIYQGSPGDFRRELIGVRTGLAKNANQRGLSLAALKLRETIIADRIALVGAPHPDLAMDYSNLATSLSTLARYAEAEAAYERAQDMLRELLGPRHMRTMFVLRARASAQLEQGKFDQVEQSIAEVLTASQTNAGAFASLLPPAHLTLSRLAFYRHDFARALDELARAQIDPKSVAHYAGDRRVRARIALAKGDASAALAYLDQALSALGADSQNSIAFQWTEFLHALSAHQLHPKQTPLAKLVQVYEALKSGEGAGGSEQLEALLLLGRAQRNANDLASALSSHQNALELAKNSHALGDYGLAIAHAELALSYANSDQKLANYHAGLARALLQRIAPMDLRLQETAGL
jgi:eukaryotic-like serine/threonine-protein kinase